MLIVVTGATGTVGSRVVEQLTAKGIQVRAVVRDLAKATKLPQHGVEVVQGDLGVPESLERAFRGADKLFLVSSSAENQAELQGNAVHAAKKTGIRHIVKLSVLGAAPDSPVKLARWHYQNDQEIQASGIAWTILQPTFFIDNILNYAETIKKDGTFYAPMKDGRAPMVDARDIAAVAVTVLTEAGHDGKTYVVTGPRPISYTDIATTLTEQLGRKVKYVDVPLETARSNMRELGIPDWYVEDMLTLSKFFASGGGEKVTSTVRELTGRDGYSVEDWERDHLSAFK